MLSNLSGSDAARTLLARVGLVDWVEQNGAVEASGAITWTWQVTFTGGLDPVDNSAWYSGSLRRRDGDVQPGA